MGDSLQCFARDPCRTAFIANDRAPPTGAYLLPLPIAATTDRTSPGNNNQTWLAVGRAIQRNIAVRN